MRVYRPILVALTLLVTVLISATLLGSWTEPQAQSQLNLYQSDLLLQASEWESLSQETQDSPSLRKSFLGENPIKDALKNYETVRKSAKADLDKLKQPSLLSPSRSETQNTAPNTLDVDPGAQPVPRSLRQTRGQLINELDVRLGLLYAQTGQRDKALKIWSQTIEQPQTSANVQNPQSAQVLRGLWSDPPEIFPDAELILSQNLTGWFRFESLSQLYQLQQRQDALSDLNLAEQETAQNAFVRLLAVGIMPVLGSIAGLVILAIWGLRSWLSKRSNAAELERKAEYAKAPSVSADAADLDGLPSGAIASPQFPDGTTSEVASERDLQRTVLWPTETIWQVMVLWFMAFFGVSFFLVPLVVSFLGLKPEMLDARLQAYLALFSYACLMTAGFSILQLSLRRYVPNVLRWFSVRLTGNWIGWGLGGYLVALPMVLIVSLLNQKLLQEQGGGNPILEIIVKSNSGFTIGLLWFLVAVCAPVFEETLFRGFFLTSLTRHIPTWQAIGFSGVLFAIAHLNLGDLLPLSLLGMVLGFVYLRSRNLLSSILLHSLWNSGSFISLLILGGGA